MGGDDDHRILSPYHRVAARNDQRFSAHDSGDENSRAELVMKFPYGFIRKFFMVIDIELKRLRPVVRDAGTAPRCGYPRARKWNGDISPYPPRLPDREK